MRWSRGRGVVALATAAALVVAACSGDDGGDGAASTTAPTVATTTVDPSAPTSTTAAPVAGTLGTIGLGVQEVARVDDPVAMAARPSSPDLYIAEKGGKVRIVKVTPSPRDPKVSTYQLQTTPVLDISDEVIDDGEQGLLGLAFSSDGRKLYVDYTARPDGHTVVLEYQLGDRTTVDRSSRREVLQVEQPHANHNGGQLVFGPDGYLYVGLGDGGGAGDPDGNGQDPHTLLGSILRIDPLGGSRNGFTYAIPAGNPFADGQAGAPETWLYGVRNPWRFTFDSATGDLWVADVGQGAWEEIDRLPSAGGFDAGRGANLGWNRMEGSHELEGSNPKGAVLPIYEYSHDDGRCSITGGYVYRGQAIAPLQGAYLFADLCAPGLRAIQVDGDQVIDERSWTDLGAEAVQSFGEDRHGELFMLLGGGPVLKIVPQR